MFLRSQLRPRLLSSTLVRSGRTGPSLPLTACDQLTGRVGVPLFYVYPQGLDAQRLRRALREACARHPGFTGRLQHDAQGRETLVDNDEGAAFSEWRCDQTLPDYGPHHPMHRDVLRLVRPVLPWRVIPRQLPLLQVAVYHFAGGGAVLALHVVHALVDGSSLWNFLLDWSRLCLGLAPGDKAVPRTVLFDLMQSLANARDTRQVMRNPQGAERALLCARLGAQAASNTLGVYRVPAATIGQWRAALPPGTPAADRLSAADLVTAHALKLMSHVQGHDRERVVGLVADLRFRKALGLPHRLLGNALGQEAVDFDGAALRIEDEAMLALRLRRQGVMHDADEVRGYLGLIERHRRAGTLGKLLPRSVVRAADGGFMQNNYSHLPIYEVDLGSGPPAWFNPMAVPFRMLKLVPSPDGDGAMDLHLTATRRELAPFEARYGRCVL